MRPASGAECTASGVPRETFRRGPGFHPDLLAPTRPISPARNTRLVSTSVTPLATSSQMRGAAARGGAAGSTGGPCACGSTRWVLLRQPPGPALSVVHNPDGYNSPSSRRGATFSTSFLAAWRHDPTAPGPVGGCDRCQRACGTGIGEDRHRCRAHPAPTARSRCRGWWRPPSKQPLRDETNPSPAAPWSGAWTRSCAIASTCLRRR